RANLCTAHLPASRRRTPPVPRPAGRAISCHRQPEGNRLMDIAFFGSSLVSSYWNGAATYYRGLLSSLAPLGYRITFYEPDAYDRQSHRDIATPDYARVVVYPANTDGLLTALEAGLRADVVVKASGVGVFDDE